MEALTELVDSLHDLSFGGLDPELGERKQALVSGLVMDLVDPFGQIAQGIGVCAEASIQQLYFEMEPVSAAQTMSSLLSKSASAKLPSGVTMTRSKETLKLIDSFKNLSSQFFQDSLLSMVGNPVARALSEDGASPVTVEYLLESLLGREIRIASSEFNASGEQNAAWGTKTTVQISEELEKGQHVLVSIDLSPEDALLSHTVIPISVSDDFVSYTDPRKPKGEDLSKMPRKQFERLLCYAYFLESED